MSRIEPIAIGTAAAPGVGYCQAQRRLRSVRPVVGVQALEIDRFRAFELFSKVTRRAPWARAVDRRWRDQEIPRESVPLPRRNFRICE